jgi:O-antigen/teichoic acid export membrane protein
VLAVGLLASMCVIGTEVLSVMASAKYRDGAVVIPWVVAGMVIEGCTAFLAAGLYLQKKTRTIMTGVVICAVLNMLLNLALVPLLGIVGAALATLLSYGVLTAMSLFVGRRYLAVPVPWLQTAKLSALGAALYFIVSRIHLGQGFASLLVHMVACVVVYALLLLLFDSRSRDAVRWLWERRRPACVLAPAAPAETLRRPCR